MKKEKIESQFVITQYRSGIQSYTNFTTEVGLWESEKYVFEKYLKPSDKILDIGCGTGRTTFHLYQKGYEDIRGIDLTPEMIESAQKLNQHFGVNISFEEGDATSLNIPDEAFDSVIFSFNGIMSIPGKENRTKAFSEIHRVLKDKGIFIFTTHDREEDESFFEFWQEEDEKWKKGEQNPQLHEFGDVIATSKNETAPIYIHIPNKREMYALLNTIGFKVIDTFYRSERFDENEKVKKKSGECRFWVVKKDSMPN